MDGFDINQIKRNKIVEFRFDSLSTDFKIELK